MFSRQFFTLVLAACTLTASVSAVPVKREVPQEHSHNAILATVNTFLKQNNPNQIVDAVFGLLGDAAAQGGAGKISDVDCLQTATADQAFTNAKAAGSVDGQVAALTYRALERNTGAVGEASVACTSIKAVNPEIAALSQHQDPASANAASINKGIALTLAQQIKAVGGNPQDAIQSGTFAPGNIGDDTGKGNTCDVVDDAEGCIFSENKLVPDVTAAEINAAVGAQRRAALDFGTCTNPTVEFGAGLDGRKATEFSFLPENQADFNHGSALNPNIIFQFICDTLVNDCGLNNADSTVELCRSAQATAAALGEVGAAADSFNGALGFKTDFAAIKAPAAVAGRAALDFGTCSNPTVEFADNLDGRTDFSFEPVNEADFNHGSALDPGLIFDFICQQLGSSCKASAATVATCNSAATSAGALGKTGAAADAFNKALGFNTDFAKLDAQAAAVAQ